MGRVLESELIHRFVSDVEALTGTPAPRLGIALSGGPDSLALLLLAAAAFPERVEAATVDHRLRPESIGEAALAADQAASLGIPHEILPVEVASAGEGIQSAARAARYAALAAWAVRRGRVALLTAHHADDQAETLLMRLNRGSGVGGLAGIRPSRLLADGVTLFRPLLGWRRHELAAIAGVSGLRIVHDPGNTDDRYDRTRVRRHLADAAAIDPVAFARSAAALAQAEEALAHSADRLFAARVRFEGGALRLDPGDLPAELLRRVVTRCLHSISPDAAPRGERLSALLTALERGETATLAGVRCASVPGVVEKGTSVYLFTSAPPRRPTNAST